MLELCEGKVAVDHGIINAGLSQRAAWAKGQPISDLMSRALANPDLISLAAGFVDQQTLPVEPTREALTSLFGRDSAAGGPAVRHDFRPSGLPPGLAGVGCSNVTPAADDIALEQVIVTAGSNQLLHLVAESILDPGDIVSAVPPPTWYSSVR